MPILRDKKKLRIRFLQFFLFKLKIEAVAVPEGTAYRQIIVISYSATQTRKSLVKGERFIRTVWMAEMMP